MILARRNFPLKGGWSEMTINEFCFVIDNAGNQLSPTKVGKGWYMIRKGKAIQINRYPMVIQINKTVKEIDSSNFVLGIDDGSKYTGIAIIQECQTKNKPVFKGIIEHRQDVKYLMDARKGHRKYKRYHKKYRIKRFDNRSSSKRKYRLAPSIKQKKEATLRVINQMRKWITIDKINLEDVQFDIRNLTEGERLYKWQYQKSNRLDENLRIATLMRDRYSCRQCGNKNTRLEAHHIIPRRLGGSDSIYNLISLCSDCHSKVTGSEMTYAKTFQSIINGKNLNLKDAMHVMQGKNYLRQEISKIAPLELTTGGDTANKRVDWCINKTHSNDALVICNLKIDSSKCNLKEWVIKPQRRKSKAKVDNVDGFKHRDLVKYTKKNGEFYIGYITALYPDKKQCNITTIDGKILKGYGVKPLKLIWRFNKIYWF
jgi:5-methylcytosine-specific restriction endonuclease McrA